MRKSILWIVPFLIFSIISAFQVALNFSFMAGVISITGLIFYGTMWLFVLTALVGKGKESKCFEKYLTLLLWLGIINAIFAIYQYHFDASIFGLSSHSKYGNIELLSLGKITRRAGSLIGSPQNLSLLLGITSCLIIVKKMKIIRKAILFLLVIYAGIITVSAAYFAFLITFLLSWFAYTSRNKKKIGLTVLLFCISIGSIISMQKVSNLNNRLIGGLYIADMWTENAGRSERIYKYIGFFKFDDLSTFLFGNGAGTTDRLMEVYGEKYGINLSESFVAGGESYITKLYFEIGIIGLSLFCFPYFIAILNSYSNPGRLNQFFFAFLLATFINLLFTPSFTGLTMSCIIWPFILYPLSVNKIYKPKISFGLRRNTMREKLSTQTR
jgi:hypothetical protein